MVKADGLGLQVGKASVSVRANGIGMGTAACVGLSTTSAADMICSSTTCSSDL